MEALFIAITTALRSKDAPYCLQIAPANLDTAASTISIDVTTRHGRKIFDVQRSSLNGCPRTVVRWRHEPATLVSGTLGDMLGGTPEMLADAAIVWIKRHIGP